MLAFLSLAASVSVATTNTSAAVQCRKYVHLISMPLSLRSIFSENRPIALK